MFTEPKENIFFNHDDSHIYISKGICSAETCVKSANEDFSINTLDSFNDLKFAQALPPGLPQGKKAIINPLITEFLESPRAPSDANIMIDKIVIAAIRDNSLKQSHLSNLFKYIDEQLAERTPVGTVYIIRELHSKLRNLKDNDSITYWKRSLDFCYDNV